MPKLLSANLARLWKNKFFWICLAVSFAIPASIVLSACLQAARNPDVIYALDRYYLQSLPFLGFFVALFTSMFLGTEYSDGTIRNKLIVGHDRVSLYLANWLTCCGASLLFLAAALIAPFVGAPKLGFFQITTEARYWVVIYLVIIFFTIALSAIFTLVAMNVSNKASAVVAASFLFFVMLIGASVIYNALCEPEMVSGIVLVDGKMQMGEPTPNPQYIGGTLRKVYEILLDILPTGQAILLTDEGLTYPLRKIIFSILLAGISVFGGILFFQKKNLK